MFFCKFSVLALIFCAVFLGGCASAPTVKIVPAPPQVDRETMEKRMEEFSKALTRCEVRGLAFHPENLRTMHFRSPEEFIEGVKRFGFNRLYMYVNTPETLEYPLLPAFLRAAAAAEIPVEAVLPQSEYVIGRRGNFILKLFVSGGTTLEEITERIRKFPAPGFAGITVQAEPHLFTRANSYRPKNLVFAWDEKTYGAGFDNDMIMKMTLEQLDKLNSRLGGLSYTVGIPDFYRQLVTEKKLTAGSITDFRRIAPRVLVRSSGNIPSELIASISGELEMLPKEKGGVLAGITLADHTSVSSGALRRRNWQDFVNILTRAVDAWKAYPAFEGVVIGPFGEIETLHEER